PGDVKVENAVEMSRAVDDQRLVDRLAALGGAAATRGHADTFVFGDFYRLFGFFYRTRNDNAERHHLIVRGIGRIAAAGETVECHFAAETGLQPPLQPRFNDRHSASPESACAITAYPSPGHAPKLLDRNVTFIVDRHQAPRLN